MGGVIGSFKFLRHDSKQVERLSNDYRGKQNHVEMETGNIGKEFDTQPLNSSPSQDNHHTKSTKLFATKREIKQLKIYFIAMVVFIILAELISLVYSLIKAENKSNSVTTVDQVNKLVEEKLSSNSSVRVVKKYLLCIPCGTVSKFPPSFFEFDDENNCCVESISILIQLFTFMVSKGEDEYDLKIKSLNESVKDLRENTEILGNALFATNDTNEADDDIPFDSVMWAMIQKNNKLINTLLNRRRSVLHLAGTATATGMFWTEEIQSGQLSYDKDGILVKSGGKYFMYCDIHFTKKYCNGNETFGYIIHEENVPGSSLPVARVRKGCEPAGSIDTGLSVQSVLQVGLRQHKRIKVQYDEKSQAYLAKQNKVHNIIIFEI